MKITLVQLPIFDSYPQALTPPLGLLQLAAVAREYGADPSLLDLNLASFLATSPCVDQFVRQAALSILATEPVLVGFTSMAVEAHLAILLAVELKRVRPELRIVLGGPHFGSVGNGIMRHYDCIDYVVAGEGERAFATLIEMLAGIRSATSLQGVFLRVDGTVRFAEDTRSRIDLNSLPSPAYDLISLTSYFRVNTDALLCYEHGRGCALRCSFCYSAGHWGHGVRTKKPERIVGELEELVSLGMKSAFFVGDNFVTPTRTATEICSALREANLPLSWKGYATLAQLTPEMVKSLAHAGCTAMFVGVDAVSPARQKDYKKHYFKGISHLTDRILMCRDHGIRLTCSYMLDPSDNEDSVEETLQTATRTINLGAPVCLNALATYEKTDLGNRREVSLIRYSELKPRLLYHTPTLNHENRLAKERPELFPMHQRSEPSTAFGDIHTFCHTAYSLMLWYPLTLLRFSLDWQGRILDLVESIREPLEGELANGHRLEGLRLNDAFVANLRSRLARHGHVAEVFEFEQVPLDVCDFAKDRPELVLVCKGLRRVCFFNWTVLLRLPVPPDKLSVASRISPLANMERYLVTSVGTRRYWSRATSEHLEFFDRVREGQSDIPVSEQLFAELRTKFFILSATTLDFISNELVRPSAGSTFD